MKIIYINVLSILILLLIITNSTSCRHRMVCYSTVHLVLDSNGSVKDTMQLSYFQNDEMFKTIVYDIDSTKIIYQYDSKGYISSEEWMQRDSLLGKVFRYKEYKNSRLSSSLVVFNEDTVASISISYSNTGDTVTQTRIDYREGRESPTIRKEIKVKQFDGDIFSEIRNCDPNVNEFLIEEYNNELCTKSYFYSRYHADLTINDYSYNKKGDLIFIKQNIVFTTTRDTANTLDIKVVREPCP